MLSVKECIRKLPETYRERKLDGLLTLTGVPGIALPIVPFPEVQKAASSENQAETRCNSTNERCSK